MVPHSCTVITILLVHAMHGSKKKHWPFGPLDTAAQGKTTRTFSFPSGGSVRIAHFMQHDEDVAKPRAALAMLNGSIRSMPSMLQD